jgi:hypothetical protein
MPRIGVSITKSTSFRGATQEFSDVYYYEVTGLPDTSQADTIIDNLTSYEKAIHSTLVTFVRGRLWSQGGSPGSNNMISQKNLSGTGARATVTSFDKERAFLVRLRAGSDGRGNPVYLRKWYHSCGNISTGVTITNSVLEQIGSLSAGDRAAIVSAVGPAGDANGSPLAPKLCAKSGRQPDAGANWVAHQYLEHHQLGDMWRAT